MTEPHDATVAPFVCSPAPAEVGLRLDELLALRLPRLSRMRIATLLAQAACTVNQCAAAAGYRVSAGDLIEFTAPAAAESGATTPERLPLHIVYEDAHLLVVDKPAGLLVHPTRGVKTGTLANALAYHLNHTQPPPDVGATDRPQAFIRPGLVHRLDRATSGLMVVAKTQRALSILTGHFQRRLVAKRYLALVGGCVEAAECVLDAPIGRAPEEWPKWRVLAAGRAAQTRLVVRTRQPDLTLVELEPLTGRTNQLRIHCAHAGHPIVGDDWYGGRTAARLCLHAAQLAFHHPATGDWLEFVAPLPAEVAALLHV